nr:MAG TPA_asm: hypothetical protein [Inoviridae sp.]
MGADERFLNHSLLYKIIVFGTTLTVGKNFKIIRNYPKARGEPHNLSYSPLRHGENGSNSQ